TAVGDRLFFTAADRVHGRELWKADGTRAGTTLGKDTGPGRAGITQPYLTAVGDTVFFGADDDVHGHELWKSDGTEAGTVMVKDIYPGDGEGFEYGYVTPAGRAVLF